jgi:hypothetical protein
MGFVYILYLWIAIGKRFCRFCFDSVCVVVLGRIVLIVLYCVRLCLVYCVGILCLCLATSHSYGCRVVSICICMM